jgi:hypothetical protein
MATPKLALIPTGYKAGKLYSVLPESGVGDFTVVRATEATRVNEAGLIETMGANVPRLDYSGGGCPVLLTESQRTNLVTYSEDFSQWVSGGDTVITDNVFISPDGTQNAASILLTTSFAYLQVALSVSIGDVYTFSCFVNSSVNKLTWGGGTPNGTDVYSYEDYGNGWYRQILTRTFIASGAGIQPMFSYLVAGTSLFYIYGAMLENGSYPSSYIKTEGSAVTRNADLVNGSGDAATFNDSEGVLMAEISALADDGTNRRISISNGTTSDDNRINLMYTATSNSITINYKASGTTRVTFTYVLNNVTDYNKVLMLYKSGDFRFYVNGFKLDTDSNTTCF